MNWETTPFGEVINYYNTGQVLEARERLSAIGDGRVITGNMKASDQRTHLETLKRIAFEPVKREASKQKVSKQEAGKQMSALGIEVVHVKKASAHE